MKFFNSLGPNPRLVRMFAAEKGIELPETVEVDLMGGENRQPEYMKRNPAGQIPCLELDDGSTLSETIAICEYLEELNPEKPLIGATPEERAMTRMWTRRVESKVNSPLADGFRFGEGLPLFKDRIRTIPDAADGLKAIARDGLEWFDQQLEGRQWIAGDRFSLADIALFVFLDFGSQVGQPVDPALKNVNAWLERVKARPSTEA
jgi:glutathione S-transferase